MGERADEAEHVDESSVPTGVFDLTECHLQPDELILRGTTVASSPYARACGHGRSAPIAEAHGSRAAIVFVATSAKTSAGHFEPLDRSA